LCFAVLQLGWQALRGGPLQQAVVHDGLLQPAAWLVNSLSPGSDARVDGSTLRSPQGSIHLLNGCEGVEALFLFWSACLVSARRPRHPWRAVLLGSGLLQAVNILRVAALFVAYRADPGLFDLLHSTVMPVALVLVAGLCFIGWTGSHANRVAAAA
jgi:exosortase/archaeosortase family protein